MNKKLTTLALLGLAGFAMGQDFNPYVGASIDHQYNDKHNYVTTLNPYVGLGASAKVSPDHAVVGNVAVSAQEIDRLANTSPTLTLGGGYKFLTDNGNDRASITANVVLPAFQGKVKRGKEASLDFRLNFGD